MQMKWRWVVFGLFLCGVGLVGLIKPARVLVPTWFGLTCVSSDLCIDDPSRVDEARALRDEAVAWVEARFSPLNHPPLVLFCSTKDCFSSFGDPRIAAQAVGRQAIVINATGWQPHIVRHEVIHHWQVEQFGLLDWAHRLPRWYIEGMAYVLSEDPRPIIPNADAQAQRETFQSWIADGANWRARP